jgi:nicotinamide-nucleotide amidase
MSDRNTNDDRTQPVEYWEAEVLEPINYEGDENAVRVSDEVVAAAEAERAAGDTEPEPDMPGLPPVESEVNAIPAQTAELGDVLLRADLTIAVAESLTGGELAAELVRVPGMSAVFQGATVAYQFAAKRELLGVEQSLLGAVGAVHPEVAQQMAAGVRRQFSFKHEREVDIGISTTGVAGPEPSDGSAPGRVFIGIDSIFGDRVVELDFGNLVRADDPIGSRHRIRIATVEAAIFNLLEHLAEFAGA